MVAVCEPSYLPIQIEDLRRLGAIALSDLGGLFERFPEKYGWCEEHLLLVCLCQGAAEHYIRLEHGIKDFDVWAFYEHQPGKKPFPHRRRGYGRGDFGTSKFGRDPRDKGYSGRRIDVFGRSIRRVQGQRPEDAVLRWVHGRSSSPRQIVKKPMIGIYPDPYCERVIWDPRAPRSEMNRGA